MYNHSSRVAASHIGEKCSPIALELGTTAPEMMLLPNRRDPATGSLIPSISTGGAAMNATMKQAAAVSRHGIIKTPNQPTYKRLLVEVTHSQNSSHPDSRPPRLREIVVI